MTYATPSKPDPRSAWQRAKEAAIAELERRDPAGLAALRKRFPTVLPQSPE